LQDGVSKQDTEEAKRALEKIEKLGKQVKFILRTF
jgi:hypothetical protein